MRLSTSRLARGLFALTAIVALGIIAAEARPGGGTSSGNRGSKTYSAPPSTSTAPNAAQPMQRTQPGATQAGPRAAAAAPTGSRFGSGFGGMLMGGLLGAGLFGLLSGSGLFSGLNGMAGFLGLLIQVVLIGGIIYFAVAFFRSRNAQPAMAGAPNGLLNRSGPQPSTSHGSTPAGGFGTTATTTLSLAQADYAAFEQLLVRIQDGYGREDAEGLRPLVTPEMHGYFGEDIMANQRKNVHNLTSDAKLLQGDLSEAWSEMGSDYATVAMRFSLLETTVERGTGRVISGDANTPIEVTEIWTFVRASGSGGRGWVLSAIQQS